MRSKNFKVILSLFVILTVAVGILYAIRDKDRETTENSNNNDGVVEETEKLENQASYPTGNEKELSITITTSASKSKSYKLTYIEGETAFDALNRLKKSQPGFKFEYKESDFGKFITSINSVKPDEEKQFWKFQINGKDAEVGVGEYKINRGDNLTFIIEDISF